MDKVVVAECQSQKNDPITFRLKSGYFTLTVLV